MTPGVCDASIDEDFPRAFLMLHAEGKTPLQPTSIAVVLLTALVGWDGTDYSWKRADQSKQ
jgi:hypothetical protein